MHWEIEYQKYLTNVNLMEECKTSIVMDCQAIGIPHRERPPPLMKPENKRPIPTIPQTRAEDAVHALAPLSLTPPWRRLPQRRQPHHPVNPSANDLCSSRSNCSSSHRGSPAVATSLHPRSGAVEPCPSPHFFVPFPESTHSHILTRGQPISPLPMLFEIFHPADHKDAMETILQKGGHLHEMPQLLSMKDINRRTATYNRSQDDQLRKATFHGFSQELQNKLLQSVLDSLGYPRHGKLLCVKLLRRIA